MIKGKILVTDTLFILDEHVQQLENAGYEVIRNEKPDLNENELIEALNGIDGYILGGIEYMTDVVVEASDQLKAVVFTGTGYQGHIPGYKTAESRGIKIGNTPYANVYEVSEWALAATLAMQRNLFALGPNGSEKFSTVNSLPDVSVGIIGLGRIGRKYAEMISGLGAKNISYWSRSEKDSSFSFTSKERVFGESDIVFVAVGDEAGVDFISKNELSRMKKNAMLVSISHHGIINEKDLYEAITENRVRAVLDIVKDKELFRSLPSDKWYGSNESAAYNSLSFLKRSSDMAVKTLINLLETADDQYRVLLRS